MLGQGASRCGTQAPKKNNYLGEVSVQYTGPGARTGFGLQLQMEAAMKAQSVAGISTPIFTLLVVLVSIGIASTASPQNPAPIVLEATRASVDATPAGSMPRPEQAAGPHTPSVAWNCTPNVGAWQVRASLPQSLYGTAVAGDGRYVYSAGGQDSGGTSGLVARYDPFANVWTSLSPLPTPVYGALAVFALGKIYILGGLDSSGGAVSLVQIYTITSDTWSTGAAMPGVRQQMGGGYWNDKIYAAGGFTTNTVNSAQNQTWEYSIPGDSWAVKANLPAALAGPASGIVDGHLFIIGGRNSAGAAINTNYDYSIASDTWTARAVLPTALNKSGSVVYRGSIWVFGGGTPFRPNAGANSEAAQASNLTYIYNPTANTWSTGPSQ
ncbi:MAG: hypothetical protein LUO89_03340, partial [Methanothrix sp.]|nr:hypothetical protein [Methanothrix sp.]